MKCILTALLAPLLALLMLLGTLDGKPGEFNSQTYGIRFSYPKTWQVYDEATLASTLDDSGLLPAIGYTLDDAMDEISQMSLIFIASAPETRSAYMLMAHRMPGYTLDMAQATTSLETEILTFGETEVVRGYADMDMELGIDASMLLGSYVNVMQHGDTTFMLYVTVTADVPSPVSDMDTLLGTVAFTK